MKPFRYAGIETFDIQNGTGFGVTLFVQGCSHHCPGCHNPTTWDFDGGFLFDESTLAKFCEAMGDPNIRRLTISGGEPFDQFCAVLSMCKIVKQNWPEKDIWIFTGYTYDELIKAGWTKEIADYCDVIVDGEFKQEQRDLSLAFRGSSNQRIIDVKRTKEAGHIVLLNIEE